MKLLALRSLFAVALLGTLPAGSAQAQSVLLRVTLQPDCFRPSLAAACDKRKTGTRLDLGPQIAIWISSADGTRFVDTVLVTNLTGSLGIGNRPGYAALGSGPKFPYGRRLMSLPVWAHRRGTLYDSVLMQDGPEREYWLGFHESVSSPDPYYCRPMTYQEIDVDAISCPTKRFNSVKGRFFDPKTDTTGAHAGQPYVPEAKSYYPPRNDLNTFTDADCDGEGLVATCAMSARKYAQINDLDMVAAATPAYGRPFSKLWVVPDGLPEGEYALFVEINKEFDNNAQHAYPSRKDPQLEEWSMTNNIGQPSVVFRVPFQLSRTTPVVAATSALAGYGDYDGKTGGLHPPDTSISDSPGSGAGRLLVINESPSPGVGPLSGRVLLATELRGGGPLPDAGTEPSPNDAAATDAPVADAGAEPIDVPVSPPSCSAAQLAPLVVQVDEIMAESAIVSFVEPAEPIWGGVLEYEIKRWNGGEQSDAAFGGGLAVATVAKRAPGEKVTVTVPDLKSEIHYSVGARPKGICGTGPVAYTDVTTRLREFTQLSGCFIATAAYGSPLARDVAMLRRVRDRAAAGHGMAAAAAEVYARSSPPLANLLGTSPAARAVTRGVLRPLIELARGLDRK